MIETRAHWLLVKHIECALLTAFITVITGNLKSKIRLGQREHFDKDPIADFLYQRGERTRKYTLNANQYLYHVMHFTKHFPLFNLHIIL